MAERRRKAPAVPAVQAPVAKKAVRTAAVTVPAPRSRRDLTADMVWRACPPLGKPAAPTSAIAEALGVVGPWGPVRARVLELLNQLAADGRAQRLIRDKQPGELWWRRQ